MNVGLRPRLKARPSLYDLIRNRNIDQPLRSFVEELPAELPPLPSSPDSILSTPPTPVLSNHPELVEQSANMAPKKEVARDADGEEQYGSSLHHQHGGFQLTIAMQAQFIPFLGMQS